MASSSLPKVKTNHLERTATEPRDKSLSRVLIGGIVQVNDQVRIFRLDTPQGEAPIRFLSGQWVDVFIPDIPKAGGFTITSSPSKASTPPAHGPPSVSRTSSPITPYIELAIQKSPGNRHAAWLWKDEGDILGQELKVRVGGSFVLPPPQSSINGSSLSLIKRVIFVAGGVGVNPLMSMVRFLAEKSLEDADEGQGEGEMALGNLEVHFMYSIKDPVMDEGKSRDGDVVLFLKELRDMFANGRIKGQLQLYLTQKEGAGQNEKEGAGRVMFSDGQPLEYKGRRITVPDVIGAVGGETGRGESLVYICGVPSMTDDFVDKLTDPSGFGMDSSRVLREKWW